MIGTLVYLMLLTSPPTSIHHPTGCATVLNASTQQVEVLCHSRKEWVKMPKTSKHLPDVQPQPNQPLSPTPLAGKKIV